MNLIGIKIKLLIIAALSFLACGFFLKPQMQNRTEYISPPVEIKYLSFGLKHQYSDSFWLRAVQDMDYCEDVIATNLCKAKSWLFNVINLSVELDPLFESAYYYGGLALTVIVSDYAGASVIFDKAVTNFPKNWSLNYIAGYHALFEEHDRIKASRLYLAAADNGAPPWVRLSAGRLAAEGGDQIKASEVLEQLIALDSDARWTAKLRKKIEEAKALEASQNKPVKK